MTFTNTIDSLDIIDLVELTAKTTKVPPEMVLPFSDSTEFTTEVLKASYYPSCRLISAGHATPELAIAADRAEINLIEVLNESPFTSSPEKVVEEVKLPEDIIFVANPNRLTGANFSPVEIENMLKAVPRGLLIVDEYYLDYFGITALPLLDLYKNIVVLRSYTNTPEFASFGDAGYIIAGPERIASLKSSVHPGVISPKSRKGILTILSDPAIVKQHLLDVHQESLHLATTLNKLGVQCRITPTDGLLIRVKDTKVVGNFLARYKVPIQNIDGYPGLKHYMVYRITSDSSNERLLEAFTEMPHEYYLLKTLDLRSQTLRLAKHGTVNRMQYYADNREESLKNNLIKRNINTPKSGKKHASYK